VAYPPDRLAVDFDADPCGYEAPTGLAVNFDRAELPGSTRLNLCGERGSTTLVLGGYAPPILLELSVTFSGLFGVAFTTPRAEQGSILLALSSDYTLLNHAAATDSAVLLATAELISGRALRAPVSVAIAVSLDKSFFAVRNTFADMFASLQAASAVEGTATVAQSTSLNVLTSQSLSNRAVVLGSVPLSVLMSVFYASAASCFSNTELTAVLDAVTAHFVQAYGNFTVSAQLSDEYVKSIHYVADYVESIISYIDVLSAKFDLGIVSNDGRIVRMQFKDNVVRISFSDKLSTVSGVFEKTLIVQPSTRIIDVIASDKIGSTG
jgi:hypothetical protein